ncbi:MAG TPA: DUF418 domain-containing protein [Woeseiaceae bacterium]|nr:DUF418 domain-containing protein [Woeseiaceae bacterium]
MQVGESGTPGRARPLAAPVPAADRLQGLDVLRGVAVLGILVMNVYAFALPFAAYMNPLLAGGRDWYDLGTWFATHVLFDQKFMSIFSLLYGAGIVLLMTRAESRGAAFGPLFFRRQFWLLVIGAAHAYLIWFGDILFFYAVTGMLVFLFRHLRPRTLAVAGVAFLLVGLAMSQVTSVFIAGLRAEAAELAAQQSAGTELDETQQATIDTWLEMRPTFAPTAADIDAEIEAYRSDYATIVAFRAPDVVAMHFQALPFFIIWRVGGLMLLGMALMKTGLLTGSRDAATYGRLCVWGYAVGLPLTIFSAVSAWRHGFDLVWMFGPGGVPNYVGSLFVAAGHIGLVLWLVRNGKAAGPLRRFGAVGRTALSNYLLHSLVMTSIFYGYGLGLFAHVPRFWLMSFVAGLVGAQLLVSPWWLARFRFGPAEWAWRSLTYGRAQPFRGTA